MRQIAVGEPYFRLNLKSAMQDQDMGEGEAQLTPELIAMGQYGEMEPYYGQESAVGRQIRPAVTTTPAEPAVTGGGTEGGGKPNYLNYLAQLAEPTYQMGKATVTGQPTAQPQVPTWQNNTPWNEDLYGPELADQAFGKSGYFDTGLFDQPQTQATTGQPTGTSPYAVGAGSLASNLGSMLPGLLGERNNPALSWMGGQGGALAGQAFTGTGWFAEPIQGLSIGTETAGETAQSLAAAGISGTTAPAVPLGAMFMGQSDWSNPYSPWVESFGNYIPVLGTVLGGFLEGILGGGYMGDIKENLGPILGNAQKRANSLRSSGMSDYEIYQWARDNNMYVEGANGRISEIYSPEEQNARGGLLGAWGGGGGYGTEWRYDPRSGGWVQPRGGAAPSWSSEGGTLDDSLLFPDVWQKEAPARLLYSEDVAYSGLESPQRYWYGATPEQFFGEGMVNKPVPATGTFTPALTGEQAVTGLSPDMLEMLTKKRKREGEQDGWQL